jgi:hypothetical protein
MEEFITFHKLLSRYLSHHVVRTRILSTCHGQNFLLISENTVSHIPVKVYNAVEYFVKH